MSAGHETKGFQELHKKNILMTTKQANLQKLYGRDLITYKDNEF